ncbi:type II secretion system F family protein [Clostridium algidicarnis]|uniref:type II secretion system F family protein n=1 Tax=Clostridium algidicarnis TaxID=37659 RepID=UPI001C0B601C|nr:type II secretion system F family protein [Clostridium algidicarnis]MBU3195480.1 type II secretion system F family protein [Clostridium algidicarnis]
MDRYYYIAYNLNGRRKMGTFKGREDALWLSLKTEGYYISRYHKVINLKKATKKTSYKDLEILCLNLKLMIGSGVSLLSSLNIIQEGIENMSVKNSILEICKSLKDGKSLSQSFLSYPNIYPRMFIQMIKVGEDSGRLEDSFKILGDYYKKQQKLKSKLINALSYPVVLMITVIIMFFFITIKVIPNFMTLLENNVQELPLYTKAILGISSFISAKWYLIVIILILNILLVLFNYKRSYMSNFLISRIKTVKEFYNIKFIMSLRVLIESGNTIINSIEKCTNMFEENNYKKDLNLIVADIKKGRSLYKAFKRSGLFNSISLAILKVGEESGNLEESLNHIEEIMLVNYEKKIEKNLNIIQPVSLIIVGGMILTLVITLVLPMINGLTSIS